MTKKDYIAVARTLSTEAILNEHHTPEALPILRNIMLSMADVFAAANPRFDRERFYEACFPVPRC